LIPAERPQRRAEDPVSRYLRAIGPAPLLSPRRENLIALAMVDGERELLAALEASARLAREAGELATRIAGTSRLADLGRRQLGLVMTAMAKSGEPSEPDDAADPALAAALAAHARMATAWTDLLRSNLRLVVSVARRHANRGLDVADLIQEGNIGLMKAIDRFDPQRNVKFATYAVWWIRQSISKALLDQGRAIRIPPHVASAVHEIASTRHDMLGRLGRTPTPTEIAQRMDLPLDRFRRMLTLPRIAATLDEPLGSGDGGPLLAETVLDREGPAPDRAIEKESALERARLALAALRPEERALLVRRFGIDDGRARSLRSVAREYNVSRDSLRRIEKRALRKLGRNEELRGLLDD
jgi:RNA polymerase sigma factor (sigma-70 family)